MSPAASKAAKWARQRFGEAWSLDRREFADGDTRVEIRHTFASWGPEEHLQLRVWLGLGKAEFIYTEGGHRAVFSVDFDSVVDGSWRERARTGWGVDPPGVPAAEADGDGERGRPGGPA